MAEFLLTIAGHTAFVRSMFDSTRDYCRNYLSEEPPEFSMEIRPEDLLFEQFMLDEEAREEGFRRRKFTDPFLERTAIQRKMAEYLIRHQVLMLHGSAVAVDEEGYLFTARSGTGKSTHTRLWREAFGSRAVMVNDDKPFVDPSGETILLCGAPWSGKHGLDANITVPLKGICLLRRGTENRICPISKEEALPLLLHQAYQPVTEENGQKNKALVAALAAGIPLWQMDCTRDLQAAETAHRAMSGSQKGI